MVATTIRSLTVAARKNTRRARKGLLPHAGAEGVPKATPD